MRTKRHGAQSAAERRFQELVERASGKVLMEEVTTSKKTAVQEKARKNTGLEAAEVPALRVHLANEPARHCFMDPGGGSRLRGQRRRVLLLPVCFCQLLMPPTLKVTQKVLPRYRHTQPTVLQESNTESEGLTVFTVRGNKPRALIKDLISLLRARRCTHNPPCSGMSSKKTQG